MAFIDDPIFGLIIEFIWFSPTNLDLIIFKFLIKKIGKEFSLPKGPSLLISLYKFLLIVDPDISES